MGTLAVGVCAVTLTKRRRFLWCAWWTGEPTAKPFRKPDAWSGGARTEEEAFAAAERAAGMPLQRIESRWAQAWVRVRAGRTPFPARRRSTAEDASGTDDGTTGPAGSPAADGAKDPDAPGPGERARPRPGTGPVPSHVILGIPKDASVADVKKAFRKLALATHPDHGGDPAAFARVKRAYDLCLHKAERFQKAEGLRKGARPRGGPRG